MKQRLKAAAFRTFPDAALRYFSIRSRRMMERQARELRLDDIARRVSAATNARVAKGPFKGMRLDYEALPVQSSPKFLGTYEQELHDAVERCIALAPASVLNVGSAEGYYAVGFAMRLPQATIHVADADPKAVKATMHNARLNRVEDRCIPVGIVRSGSLASYLSPGSLIVMDCEGAEFALLNPEKDPILSQCHILVEVHPEFGSPEEIASRFPAHAIEQIEPKPRTHADIPIEPAAAYFTASDEWRDRTVWLFITPSPAQAPASRRY